MAVVTPDQKTLYVNDWGSGSVGVVDVCTWTFVKNINVGGAAFSALSPDGTRYYAGVDDKVYVIDAAMRSLTTTWTLPNKPLPGQCELPIIEDLVRPLKKISLPDESFLSD